MGLKCFKFMYLQKPPSQATSNCFRKTDSLNPPIPSREAICVFTAKETEAQMKRLRGSILSHTADHGLEMLCLILKHFKRIGCARVRARHCPHLRVAGSPATQARELGP